MKVYINNNYEKLGNEIINPMLNFILDGNISADKNIFEIVTSPHLADFCLLPLMWNYYIDQNKIHVAGDIYSEATQAGKRLIIFCMGDFTAKIPFRDAVIIQSSCYKSRDNLNGNKLLAIPTFIGDYLRMYCAGSFRIREKSAFPIIGFCGQANGSLIDFVRRQINISAKQIMFKLNLLKWEPPNIEPTLFRHKIINRIQTEHNIKSNFLLRIKYRAGYQPKVKDPFHPTRIEFIKNILESDYTICMRGAGNFSVRYYETLSLGRIPIFINSDCILPLDEVIDYKDYFLWVEQNELPFLSEKILDFHNSLSDKQFKELQVACRYLWEKYLTRIGFFSYLPDALSK